MLHRLPLIAALLTLTATATLRSEEVRQWPVLIELDRVVRQAQDLADRKDASGLRALTASLRSAAERAAKDAVPRGSTKPDDVATLQKDLLTFSAELKDSYKLSDPQIVDLAGGISPLVQALFEAAGVARPSLEQDPQEPIPQEPDRQDQTPREDSGATPEESVEDAPMT